MLRTSRKSLIVAALVLSAGALALGAPGPDTRAVSHRDPSTLLESRAAVRRALHYLAGRQKPNGSFQDQPAITGLVVMAMLESGDKEFGAKSEAVTKALDYIRGFAQPDGGIYDKYYATYSTSVCVMALAKADLPKDKELTGRARTFLLDLQADDTEGFGPQDKEYGGWGYERNAPEEGEGEAMHRPDLSNTQFALEAIENLQDLAGQANPGEPDPEQARTELAYQHAVVYLQRCQNLKATNDQPWASDDGGFVYRPGESKAGETAEGGLRSYAGMTYAGLKSMVYAHLSKGDPRVQAAWEWASLHWSVTENPGLGQQGLFYYYLTMSKALNVYGAEQIRAPEGAAHDWRAELVGQLLSVQEADGSWQNHNSRWMESIPELVTAYAVLALSRATAGW